jgi:hypothetical protein
VVRRYSRQLLYPDTRPVEHRGWPVRHREWCRQPKPRVSAELPEAFPNNLPTPLQIGNARKARAPADRSRGVPAPVALRVD